MNLKWLVRNTGHESTQVTGQHKSLQVSYVFSTETDKGPTG